MICVPHTFQLGVNEKNHHVQIHWLQLSVLIGEQKSESCKKGN